MVLVLALADKPGLLDSASPQMLFFGGLGLLALGVIMLFIARRIDEESAPGELLNIAGWIIGIVGILGICSGLGLFNR